MLIHDSLDVGAFSISPALSPHLLHVPGTLRFHSRLLKTPLGDPTSLVFLGGSLALMSEVLQLNKPDLKLI